MAEYRLDVRQILDEIGGGIHVADTIELDSLVVGDETFIPRGPAGIDVMVSNAGEALIAIGTIGIEVTAVCSRCLIEFETRIEGDVEGYWPRPGYEAPEDQDVSGEVGTDGRIDLWPALLAALVVEAPFAPLHAEDCAGLCAQCGADLNVEECKCADEPDDEHPFAALKGIFTEADGAGDEQ
jgi:uncharacterized protein